MGAAGWYGHGAGHTRQAVEVPARQPNPRTPRTRAMMVQRRPLASQRVGTSDEVVCSTL